MKLVLRPYVEQDLRETAVWYEAERAGLRERFLGAVEQALEQVRERPLLYPFVHLDIRRAPLRRFPYGIYYILIEDAVHVLAVTHDARHPSIWRGRR